MSSPIVSASSQASKAGKYPQDFGKRERKIFESIKDYVDNTALAAGSITLAKLAAGISPSHVVKYAGNLTSVGGAASEVFAISGLASSDIVMLTMKTNASDRSVLAHIPATNSLTIRFSADPGAGAIISYQVLRAAS